MSPTLVPMGRPKKSEPTEPLRIPASVVKRIRRIAAHRGQDPGDYVAARFAGVIEEDERAMLAELSEELSAGPAPKPPKPKK